LIDNAAVYELKTARALIGEHKAQALHYLFLLGLHHGKLINFRPKSVEYEFVSNRITPAVRYDLRIEDSKWQDLDAKVSGSKRFSASCSRNGELFSIPVCFTKLSSIKMRQYKKMRCSSS
jgi:hypothetical protein